VSATLASQVKWDDRGLVPAVVQDAADGRVLMLAYMDRESLAKTVETGFTHFHSRSRGVLWKKGETSGHVQRVREVRLDCDGDTVLVKVDQTGPACHTGAPTCFFRVAEAGAEARLVRDEEAGTLYGELAALFATIRERRAAGDPEASYVAQLFSKGRDHILKKVAEEAGEVLLAAKGGDPKAVTREAADLLFHLLVALAEAGVGPADVAAELRARRGVSGLAEKASRPRAAAKKTAPKRKKG
jgi:phosphoribosyl-AMP cyclohydrolase / phosphoribosyl-ATP pyrophosphohydrolase